MFNDNFFISFFKITENIGITGEENLKLIKSIENKLLGYRDFCFSEDF